MRFIRVSLFSISLAVVMVATNNCSGSGKGLSSVAGYCATASCGALTAASASVYLNTQQFTMTKAMDTYGACGNSVSTTWTNGVNGVSLLATGANLVNCTDDSTFIGAAANRWAYPSAPVIFRQQYQISGLCTTSGAASNKISVSVLQNNVPILTDLYSVPYTSYSTVCDSGRFNLILTPPACSAAVYPSAATCLPGPGFPGTTLYQLTSAPLQLLVTLSTGPSLASLTTASQFATTFYVTY